MSRRHKNYGSQTSFLDLLFNSLLAFVAFFILSLLLIKEENEPKKASVEMKVEFLITVTWPYEQDNDVDTWVVDPVGNIVSFNRRENGLMHLDRDDLGSKNDTITLPDGKKFEYKEASRTYGNGSKEGRGLRKGITNNRNYVYENELLKQEVEVLKEKNEEYRKALNVFREKLNEVAVFNSNLAYATRLFTEHSTSKPEKINILRRFDDVESLKESKSLYNSIKNELSKDSSKVVSESFERKIEKTASTGSATNLIESKTYENPQFLRMKDLMSKL
jgi:hypothetical protein